MKSLEERVNYALDQIRPFLNDDGGDISLAEISADGIVKVHLHGACSSCSMSPMTLKAGVEESIKKSAPEIKSVEAVSIED